MLIGRAIIPESRDETPGVLPDLLGVVLLIGGTALLAFSIIQSEAWGWSRVWVVGALFGGAISLVAFVVRSSRVTSPALDLTLFRERTFSLANAGVFCYSIGFTAMFFGSILFLTRIWGYTLLQVGLALMPGPLMVVLLAPIAGRLAAVHGHRRLLLPGGLVYASDALVLLLGLTTTPHFLAVWLPRRGESGDSPVRHGAGRLADVRTSGRRAKCCAAIPRHLPADDRQRAECERAEPGDRHAAEAGCRMGRAGAAAGGV